MGQDYGTGSRLATTTSPVASPAEEVFDLFLRAVAEARVAAADLDDAGFLDLMRRGRGYVAG